MYKPLPESVTIKQSGINGLGLFADQDIKQGTNLGMSHISWMIKLLELLWEDSLIILTSQTAQK